MKANTPVYAFAPVLPFLAPLERDIWPIVPVVIFALCLLVLLGLLWAMYRKSHEGRFLLSHMWLLFKQQMVPPLFCVAIALSVWRTVVGMNEALREGNWQFLAIFLTVDFLLWIILMMWAKGRSSQKANHVCPVCGAYIGPDWAFCMNCGN